MEDTGDKRRDVDDEPADAPPTAYELSLTGGGLELKRSLTEGQALEVLAAVMGVDPPGRGGAGAPRESAQARARGGGAHGLSLREYFDDAQPKRNPDKILVVASYLKEIEGVELFTPDDLKTRFRSAGESVPGNWARDFRWAIQNGWIAEDQTSGDYYVTKKGDDAVADRFSAEVKKATAVKQRVRRRPKKTDES